MPLEATWRPRAEQARDPANSNFVWDVAPWPGDSIVAWYSSGRRLAVFDSNGNHRRTFALGHGQGGPMFRPHAVAARDDGTVLSMNPVEPQDSTVIQVWSGEALIATFDKQPDVESYYWTGDHGERSRGNVTYGNRLTKGFWGDLIVASRTDRYEIRAFEADGTLARIVRREHCAPCDDPGRL